MTLKRYEPFTPEQARCAPLTLQQQQQLDATGSVKGLSDEQRHMVVVNKHRDLGLPDNCGAYVVLPIGGGATLYESARLWNLVGLLHGFSFDYSNPHEDEVTETTVWNGEERTHTHKRIIQWAHLYDATGRKLDSDKTIVRLTKPEWKRGNDGKNYRTGNFVNLIGEERDNKEKAAVTQAKRAVLAQYLGIPLPPNRPQPSEEQQKFLDADAGPAIADGAAVPPPLGTPPPAAPEPAAPAPEPAREPQPSDRLKPWDNPVFWQTLETVEDFESARARMRDLKANAEARQRLIGEASLKGIGFADGKFYLLAEEEPDMSDVADDDPDIPHADQPATMFA